MLLKFCKSVWKKKMYALHVFVGTEQLQRRGDVAVLCVFALDGRLNIQRVGEALLRFGELALTPQDDPQLVQ